MIVVVDYGHIIAFTCIFELIKMFNYLFLSTIKFILKS